MRISKDKNLKMLEKYEYQRTLKENNAITLVALIVTIIILLILAGISISAITNTGLFEKAKQAKQKSEEIQEQEDAILGVYEEEINKYKTNRNDGIHADGSWNSSKNVNSPELMNGMTGIYWDKDGKEVTVTADNQHNWYDYENQKWANAKTQDGSYWVWIPRYAYKIESGCYTSNAGKIKIKFLKETSNKDKDNNTINTTYPKVTADGTMQDYVVHPSFTNGSKTAEQIANGAIPFGNGEWDKEITGYWVAKYAAGFQASTTDANDATKVVNGSDTIVYSNRKYKQNEYTANAIGQNPSSLPAMSYPVFKPLTYAYNCISTGDAYTLSREIAKASSFYGLNSSKTDSHQMKNSEWGAVAYLAQSSYGRDKTEITINSKNLNDNSKKIWAITGYAGNTANGVDASTTNNMSGIFDLSGCVCEYIASYISNGNENISNYGGEYANTTANINGYKTLSTKYVTVYPYNSSNDTYTNNYSTYLEKKSETYGFGDAILEISTSGANNTTWNEQSSWFLKKDYTFFQRGGKFNSAYPGIFNFISYKGIAIWDGGFRSVLVAL